MSTVSNTNNPMNQEKFDQIFDDLLKIGDKGHENFIYDQASGFYKTGSRWKVVTWIRQLLGLEKKVHEAVCDFFEKSRDFIDIDKVHIMIGDKEKTGKLTLLTGKYQHLYEKYACVTTHVPIRDGFKIIEQLNETKEVILDDLDKKNSEIAQLLDVS